MGVDSAPDRSHCVVGGYAFRQTLLGGLDRPNVGRAVAREPRRFVADMRLWCQECGRRSSPEAKGWRLHRTDDPDEDEEPTLAVYCAVCAYVEFGGSRRERTESD